MSKLNSSLFLRNACNIFKKLGNCSIVILITGILLLEYLNLASITEKENFKILFNFNKLQLGPVV